MSARRLTWHAGLDYKVWPWKACPAVGGTAELLKLRQKALEYAGLKTLAAFEIEAVRQLVKVQRVSLLKLSYTVSEDECEEALKVAHSCNPPLKTLMLGLRANHSLQATSTGGLYH